MLDYELSDYVWDGVRRAYLSMAELQFAAGAKQVFTGHELAPLFSNWAHAKTAIAALPMQPLLTKLVSVTM